MTHPAATVQGAKYDFIFAPVPNWLMRRPEVSQGAKLAWARLKQFCGTEREWTPNPTQLATLADELGVSWEQARRYVAELRHFDLVGVRLHREACMGSHYRPLDEPAVWKPKRASKPRAKKPNATDLGSDTTSGQIGPEGQAGCDPALRSDTTREKRGSQEKIIREDPPLRAARARGRPFQMSNEGERVWQTWRTEFLAWNDCEPGRAVVSMRYADRLASGLGERAHPCIRRAFRDDFFGDKLTLKVIYDNQDRFLRGDDDDRPLPKMPQFRSVLDQPPRPRVLTADEQEERWKKIGGAASVPPPRPRVPGGAVPTQAERRNPFAIPPAPPRPVDPPDVRRVEDEPDDSDDFDEAG